MDGEPVVSKGRGKKSRKGDDIEDWMRTHSIRDMEEIVTELATRGENVNEMAKAVHTFEDMVEEEKEWEQKNIKEQPRR